MRVAAIALVPVLALAACATPRESCITEATRDLRQVNRFVAEAQANIARGYGLETRQETQVRRATCEGETTLPDGTVVETEFECERTVIIDVEVPVALDLNAERARLASLMEQQATLERQSNAVVQACVAAHPE